MLETSCFKSHQDGNVKQGGKKQSIHFISAVFTAVLAGENEAGGTTEPPSEVNEPLYFQDTV